MMNGYRFFLWWFNFLGIIASLLVISLKELSPLQAQSIDPPILPVQFNRPPLSNRGAPGDRQAGASRSGDDNRNGSCSAFKKENFLTALSPESKDTKALHHVWQLTLQTSPTLWFYVPYSPTEIGSTKFVLWDETDDDFRKHQLIYEGTVAIAETPGIIALSLSSSLKLERNRRYHWYLLISVRCPSKEVAIGINGWIWLGSERLLPILSVKQSEREKVIFYAQYGIWTDALTMLARLKIKNSAFNTDWSNLLQDVNLQSLAQEKIVPCCSLKPLQPTREQNKKKASPPYNQFPTKTKGAQ